MIWMWLFILESVSVRGDHRSLLWAAAVLHRFRKDKRRENGW
jgi:hypothetical protein